MLHRLTDLTNFAIRAFEYVFGQLFFSINYTHLEDMLFNVFFNPMGSIIATIALVILLLPVWMQRSTPNISRKRIPTAVNYHFTRKCNYKCGFCFHTAKSSHVEPLTRSKSIIKQVREAGGRKINFAGGEPFLPEYRQQLGEMVKYAKDIGFESVSIISNGRYVTEDWFEKYASYLDILGISCDSHDENINQLIGRGSGSHIDYVRKAGLLCKKYKILFKINTVVNRYNWNTDMSQLINELDPMRWKLFQALPIEGENIGSNAQRDVSKFLITDTEFSSFVTSHQSKLTDPNIMKVESNDIMQSSYFLIDEYGRFLDSSLGKKTPTQSILDVGIDHALKELFESAGGGFDETLFLQRGGLFSDSWSKFSQSNVTTTSTTATSTSSCNVMSATIPSSPDMEDLLTPNPPNGILGESSLNISTTTTTTTAPITTTVSDKFKVCYELPLLGEKAYTTKSTAKSPTMHVFSPNDTTTTAAIPTTSIIPNVTIPTSIAATADSQGVASTCTTSATDVIPSTYASIAIEGLDGVGKTTVAKALALKLNAYYMRTPPESIRRFRPWFDSQSDALIRKGYYMVGNFLAGEAIETKVYDRKNGTDVVIDRYYASTIAYNVGKESIRTGIQIDDLLLNTTWPQELYRPSYMILLTMPEPDRQLRRASRLDIPETKEERLLRETPALVDYINAAYEKLGCIKFIIHATDSVESIVDRIELYVNQTQK